MGVASAYPNFCVELFINKDGGEGGADTLENTML